MLPSIRKPRELRIPDTISVQAKDQQLKARQKKNFDNQYDIRELSSSFSPGDTIWIPDQSSDTQLSNQVDRMSLLQKMAPSEEIGKTWFYFQIPPQPIPAVMIWTWKIQLIRTQLIRTSLIQCTAWAPDRLSYLSSHSVILPYFQILALFMSNNTKIKQVLWIA